MQPQSGPLVYRNWLAMNESQPCVSTAEYLLFTDAHITGQISQGAYQFINTIPLWEEGRPSAVSSQALSRSGQIGSDAAPSAPVHRRRCAVSGAPDRLPFSC